jgi:S1-C subfamily serine protease
MQRALEEEALMVQSKIWKSPVCSCFALTLALLFAVFLWATEVRSAEPVQQDESAKSGAAGGLSQGYSKEIMMKGKVVVVSKALADKIRADNSIVMAAVTVKASLDKRRKGNGYRIVAVDKGSLAQKLGILKNDIVQEVNGFKLVSADDVNQAQERFMDATDLEVRIIRKGRARILYYAVR